MPYKRTLETIHPAFYVLVILGVLLMSVAVASPAADPGPETFAAPVEGNYQSIWTCKVDDEANLEEVWAEITASEVTEPTLEGPPLPALIVHTVETGDTLWDLAVAYKTTIETINRLNNLPNLHHLKVGQNLLIIENAVGTLHRIADGESLEAIAERHKVDIAVILATNEIDATEPLTVGEQLIIPTGPAKTPMETSIAARSGGGFIWPLRGRITSAFGWRWGSMHNGIDIAASTGNPIVAAREGRVTFAGWNGGYGNLIIISHGAGVETRYAHLSRIEVSVGTRVSSGQRIGRAGSTGFSTGPHLHFEVRINGTPVNPRLHLP